MFKKIKNFFGRHKFLAVFIILAIAAAGYYFFTASNQTQASTKYILGAAKKDTLISSVSATGQVEVLNSVDVKAKASGEIIYLPIKEGQEVKAGAILAQLDSLDAQKAVRDAQASLESAQIALEKLLEPADELSVMQAEDALNQAKELKQEAQDNLDDLAEDEFNEISNVFLELPSLMSGLEDMLLGRNINSTQCNIDYYADLARIYNDSAETAIQYRNDTYDSYNSARAAYDKNFADFKAANRYSDSADIHALLDQTYATLKSVSNAVKNANNLVQFYRDTLTKHLQKPASFSETHLASLSSYTGKTNSFLSNLSSLQQKADNYEKTVADSDRTILEKQLSLEKVQAGPEATDVRSQKITVENKQDALVRAKADLADYTVRAPFDGVISKVSVVKGDTAGSAAIATLITKQQVAAVSFNEIDAAKIKIGQKATLTFDAVEDLTMTGQVVQIDLTGTVSQGVVSYSAQISFDTQDERIKPGMSVAADIITEAKQNVLVVPSSAVKTLNGQSYVQLPDKSETPETLGAISQIVLKSTPQRQTVEIGSSNDSYTEIISGLDEGEIIIAQTISSSLTSNSSNRNSGGFGMPGMGAMVSGGGERNATFIAR